MASQIPLSLNLDENPRLCSDEYQMAQQAAVSNALGTLLGYLGSEVATSDIFERLLWPSRFYSGFNIFNGPKMAFFMPMGGPLHKAALQTMDKILSNGPLHRRDQGHMLGSPFYHDTHANYTVYDCVDPSITEKEHVRNGFWTRVIANIPIPSSNLKQHGYETKSNPEVRVNTHAVVARSIHRVSYLRLSVPTKEPPASQVISVDSGPASMSTYLALVVTELSGIATSCCVLAIWNSWFMLLWLAPLTLKLLSALLTLDRHPLQIPKSAAQSEWSRSAPALPPQHRMTKEEQKALLPPHQKRFEIDGLPHGFLILEGDESLILQFFRHYSHPVRNRFREYAQVIIIILCGFIFPCGLLCSLLWMPTNLQYIWMAYELYATCAMHIYRYAGGQSWGATEEQIARAFAQAARRGEPQKVFLGGKQGVIMAELETTYHTRYRDGKLCANEILHGKPRWLGHTASWDSSQSSSRISLGSSSIPRSSSRTSLEKS